MPEAAQRLLGKLRVFVESCDEDERRMLALLLAPGLAGVHTTSDDDVRGFAMHNREPRSLADAIASALEHRQSD